MRVIVIKYGGSLLEIPSKEAIFLDYVAAESRVGRNKIIVVHGGGKEISRQMKKEGLEPRFDQNGRRLTDEKTMEVVERALLALNQAIVKRLQDRKVQCKGASGCENSIVRAKASPELGRVGIMPKGDGEAIRRLLAEDLCYVLYPVGADETGHPLNINADDFAQAIAIACKADELILLTDSGGILNKSKQLIVKIGIENLQGLIDDNTITGGMVVKVEACKEALLQGVGKVTISSEVESDAQGFRVSPGTTIVKGSVKMVEIKE